MTAVRAPVLIANRGEIAIRIARTCKSLGFPTVAVYSEADVFAEHVRACDRSVFIGEAAPKESYLNIEKIIAAAKETGAKFIHPGYGFLSERASFVEACDKAGLVFVGPSAAAMNLMGDKIRARGAVDRLKVARVPGSTGAIADATAAAKIAREIGYPVLLKATAGGGGKGMRRVDAEKDLAASFEGASREALNAFGDGAMFLEKFILEPHHVEIQVFGDGKGRAIHLGERECSIQRRHQKVWEESPSPILELHPKTRAAMFVDAVKIAENVKYAGAGTMEFIVDGRGNHYFLEMNTRLQVEHPVTEWVTGVDLVAWQLLLAAGEFTLPAAPDRKGSAIEVRLYAEDPQTFLPAPGPLGMIDLPSGPFVRTDSAFHEAGEVSLFYDPMIAKISVWAPTRKDAVERLRVALNETRVLAPSDSAGLKRGSLRTNLSFLRRLARNPDVIHGNTTTDLISKNASLTADPPGGAPGTASKDIPLSAALATAIYQMIRETSVTCSDSPIETSVWKRLARQEGLRP